MARVRDFTDTVVNNQPAVPGQDGRSAAANFEPLPGRHRGRQPMMRSELAEVIEFAIRQGRLAVGNPDAFPIEIHVTGRGMAGRFLWTSAGKKWPVEHGQFRVPGGIRNGDRKEAGIFVIHVAQFDAVPRSKGGKPQALPVEEILRWARAMRGPWAENAV